MHLRPRAFTLVELAIVVAIIAVIAAIAAARASTIQRTASMNAAYSSLRALANAAQLYRAIHGSYPPDRLGGEYPAEFEEFLSEARFAAPLPFGLELDWNGTDANPWNALGPNASFFQQPRTPGLWEELDRRFDNNSITTGTMRAANTNQRNYCIFLDP